ncbi:MAG: DUF268 domain-containing protein [Patescibacteria group bacterium]
MKDTLKNFPSAKYAVIVLRTLKVHPWQRLKQLTSYFSDYRKYRRLNPNENYTLKTADLFPRIKDKTQSHNIDPVYFIQGAWCMRKIFESRPKKHVDVASQAQMVGIISQFTPTTMVDIRPLSVSLPNLSFIRGDITHLPFRDGEIDSLSSICVIEHIGLGRYGDHLDQFGTEKAASELCRVLAKGGSLYISVPVDKESKIYFNAHRAFTRDHVLSLFGDLRLAEELYIYGKETENAYDPSCFGTGLYHFIK